MTVEDIQGKTFPGYGRCIYCGSDGSSGGLSDEHIVPFSLHGNTVIQRASCVVCKQKIDPVDRHLGRSVFGQYRVHAGIQTRNRKERPTVLPARFVVKSETILRDLPIADHPYSMAMPVWGEPGFFRGAPIDAPFPEAFFHIYHYLPPNIHDTLGLSKDEEFQIWSEGRVDVDLFARGIAKIAYCHAVLTLGLDGFRPLLLPKIILGESSATPYFVGSPLIDPQPPFDRRVLHFIQRSLLQSQAGPLKLHLMAIRLFAASAYKGHGMPTYYVIVGAPKLGDS
jgi:hypothetical protein